MPLLQTFLENRYEFYGLIWALVRHTSHTLTDPEKLRRELAKTRRRGFALDHEESLLGINCVGAPILDDAGRPVAALFITGPSHRIHRKNEAELGRLLNEACQLLSRNLKGAAPSPVAGRALP